MVVILAAGSARRFGATKQLAGLRGRPLIAHAIAAARTADVGPVLVVVGHDARAVGDAAAAAGADEVVPNPDHRDGQATSLRAGVAAARARGAGAIVVLLGDEPDVPAAAVVGVAQALAGGAEVVRTGYDDGAGHPVGLHRRVFPRLTALTGDEGARRLLADADLVAVPGPRPRDVDHPGDLPTGDPGDPGDGG